MGSHKKFTISECFYYEDMTRKHPLHHKKELTIYELIKIGIEKDNYNYIYYLIFKRLHLIEDLIKKHTIDEPDFKLNLEQYMEEIFIDDISFENLLNYYARMHNCDGTNAIDIEDLIKIVIEYKHWFMLYYIYFKERDKLKTFMFEEDEKYCEYQRELKRNRKFYIIQM